MFGKKGSKILKLPSVRNSFTLAMTNKLVVIMKSLKVPKIKKILLHEMKFLPPEPLIRWLPPPDPCPLSSTEFVEPSPPNKIPGYTTDSSGGLILTGENKVRREKHVTVALSPPQTPHGIEKYSKTCQVDHLHKLTTC